MRLKLVVLFICITVCILPNIITAHVPVTGNDNEHLESAMIISDPIKSWAIYSTIHHGGEARYYRLDMKQGEVLYVSIFVPPQSYMHGFRPNVIITGPNIGSTDSFPSFVEVPENLDILQVEKQIIGPIYEPFGPTSYYRLAEKRMTVPVTGTYYIIVYDSTMSGNFGLAIGYREEFTLTERILSPFSIIRVHQWEGQSLGFILAPLIATFVIGLGALLWHTIKGGSPHTIFGWILSLAGLFFLGSGAMHFTQMIVALNNTHLSSEAIITILLFLPSIIFAFIAFRIALNEYQKISIKKRIVILIIGILSLGVLLINSGLIIGSGLALLASILPTKKE